MVAICHRNLVKLSFLLFLLTGPFCACKSQPHGKWLRNMEVTIYHGGGMVPESFTVMINRSSCSYIHWQQPKTDTLSFICSQEELDNLLIMFNTKDFTNITSGESVGIVYDRPTTSIEFRYGDNLHKVSVGATEEIKKGRVTDFNELWSYIIQLAMRKTGQGPQR